MQFLGSAAPTKEKERRESFDPSLKGLGCSRPSGGGGSYTREIPSLPLLLSSHCNRKEKSLFFHFPFKKCGGDPTAISPPTKVRKAFVSPRGGEASTFLTKSGPCISLFIPPLIKMESKGETTTTTKPSFVQEGNPTIAHSRPPPPPPQPTRSNYLQVPSFGRNPGLSPLPQSPPPPPPPLSKLVASSSSSFAATTANLS